MIIELEKNPRQYSKHDNNNKDFLYLTLPEIFKKIKFKNPKYANSYISTLLLYDFESEIKSFERNGKTYYDMSSVLEYIICNVYEDFQDLRLEQELALEICKYFQEER